MLSFKTMPPPQQPWEKRLLGQRSTGGHRPRRWMFHHVAVEWLHTAGWNSKGCWEAESKGSKWRVRTTEDEMTGWHHRVDGRESDWTLGVSDGQGGLACCNSWGCKELDITERMNWTEPILKKGPRGATPRSRSGGVAVRRYPSSKVRSSSCT